MPDDAAKGFGRSASLAAAGAEGAKPCATATPTSQHHIALLLIPHTSAVMTHQPPHFRTEFRVRVRDRTRALRVTSRNLLTRIVSAAA